MRYIFLFFFLCCGTTTFAQDSSTILQLTTRWSSAVSDQDLRTLAALYSNKVQVYGKGMAKRQVLKAKLDFYLKYPLFSQRIVGTPNVEKISVTEYLVTFTKQWQTTADVLEVTGYLRFSNATGEWKIIQETDDITEKRIKAKKVVKPNTAVQPQKEKVIPAEERKKTLQNVFDELNKTFGEE